MNMKDDLVRVTTNPSDSQATKDLEAGGYYKYVPRDIAVKQRLDIQFERNRPNPKAQTAEQEPEGAMLPYKLEQRRSALGAEQWVVVPNNDKEHVRPASQVEVSLWKNLQAAESEMRLLKNNLENARRMNFERGNRLRFEQRMSHGRGIKR